MKKLQKSLALLLSLALTLSFNVGAVPTDTLDGTLDAALADSAAYMVKTVAEPQIGSIGGEWAILGLARSGSAVPADYFAGYYNAVEAAVTECKGVLDARKYTEYSRVALTLAAIGKNPADVGGYNLLAPLGDYEKTIWQGLNGPVWALLALDSAGYEIPQNPAAKTQATRQLYVQRILDCQLPDGGWSLSGTNPSDPDLTGMALQALAKYQDQKSVKAATDKGLDCLSKLQEQDGGYSSWKVGNSESVVQVIVALCTLGIPMDDPRFVKNGKNPADNLMSFYRPGKGFLHTSVAGGNDQMASEQGLYALAALKRQRDGKTGLYDMSDVTPDNSHAVTPPKTTGDAVKQPIVNPGKTFADIAGNPNQKAIEALAARGIISGKTDAVFAPDAAMSRSEFAAIVVKALGLTPNAVTVFADVPTDAWYAPMVGTAYSRKIVSGTDATHFNPLGTITRQEAAVMTANAAKLCGMDAALDATASRDILSVFDDYRQSADWAKSSLAFCCQKGILSQDEMTLKPLEVLKRCDIAQMIYNLLSAAELL